VSGGEKILHVEPCWQAQRRICFRFGAGLCVIERSGEVWDNRHDGRSVLCHATHPSLHALGAGARTRTVSSWPAGTLPHGFRRTHRPHGAPRLKLLDEAASTAGFCCYLERDSDVLAGLPPARHTPALEPATPAGTLERGRARSLGHVGIIRGLRLAPSTRPRPRGRVRSAHLLT
jgi:hypothetical protein